jgi:alanyl-tRNA synthetase
MAKEKGYEVDMKGFEKGLEAQKERSRKAAAKDATDWVELIPAVETEFVGYHSLESNSRIVKYRKVVSKKKTVYEVVLDKTPFYAESGGQVGDSGTLTSDSETLKVLDTKKENNLIVHLVDKEPQHPEKEFIARVDEKKRLLTTNNHSATHLMHAALRKVLGKHVEQKGSLVSPERLRFDFSHFSRLTHDEIREIENIVNDKIRENIPGVIKEDIPIEEAKKMGAMALFGEKYGDKVRVVIYDPNYSVELCGGTHVKATGQIGLFKIVSESGIAAGVRRIEAVTGRAAEDFVNKQIDTLNDIKGLFKNATHIVQNVASVIEENSKLHKEIEKLVKEKSANLGNELLNKAEQIGDVLFIAEKVDLDMNGAKTLVHSLIAKKENVVAVIALENNGKVNLIVGVSDELTKKGFHAGNMIREISKKISGGGGGQPHFATAGGKDKNGIAAAFEETKKLISNN